MMRKTNDALLDFFADVVLKEFAHFLIDRAEGGVIPVCDLPDLLIDFQTKENKDEK